MPRFLPWVLSCALAALVPLAFPACSSSDDDDNAASGDSGVDQDVGTEDDEGIIGIPEAEIPKFDSFVPGSCATSSFCVSGEVCGFPSDGVGGCQQPGTCVFAAPPTNDAGATLVACGCNGQNVPYVTPSLTSMPVISPIACVDASTPSGDGGDAGDASPDAGTDAGDAGSDASDAAAD